MLHKPHRLRAMILCGAFAMLGATVVARLASLQIDTAHHYADRAERQHTRRVVVQPERGEILDRVGRPLAQSTGRMTVYVNPEFLLSNGEPISLDRLASATAQATGERVLDVRRRLEGKGTIALAKTVTPEAAQRVVAYLDGEDVDTRGWWQHRESKRMYPRHLASQTIGFCAADKDGDNLGIEGIEAAFDEQLRGQRIETSASRTGISQALEPVSVADIRRARGNTLVLTIDAVIQETAEEALAEAVTKWEAAGGCAVVLDVRTGDVLALANYPGFDNNEFSKATSEQRRNRALTDPLETGSVVKLFTAAMLVDLGLLTPDTLVDCKGGFAVIDRRRITDAPGHEPLHVVPFRVALRYSSNVGIVAAAQQMDNETWYGYLRAFGFGAKTDLGLRGESAGILHPLEKWTRFSRTSLPMGYEISITPIQTASAVASLVNGGKYLQPRLVKEVRTAEGEVLERHEPEVLREVIRPATSAVMRDLMEDVVEAGTGKNAQVPGYLVGGKTGTTVKSHIKTHKEYISSFCGVAPLDDPRVVIYVYVDAPTKARYGGTVAAPAFSKIARVTMLHLGIPPNQPVVEEAAADPATLTADPNAPAPTPIPEGAMPELRGMSLAELRRKLPEVVASVRIGGTGLVADQQPAPGTPLTPETRIYVTLTPDGRVPESAIAAAAAQEPQQP